FNSKKGQVLDTTVKVDFQVGIPNRIRQDKQSILPSITRFMALSLKYNDLLDNGYSIRNIADFEGVDKSYILRIVKLIFLSPKIQEKILLLPRSSKYRSYMSAKKLLKLAEILGFGEQEGVFYGI
ncbi:MAG: hypothetical protein HOA19_07230, partial [Candidatus Marinimicrobia bacterium]|nr:hypothetical protein [Candidatus Neomarinimicrobiota bacterium]MBT6867125.1 hypothetical protein [Candidatus Neomarinimicrobiota bacterium]MBT7515970.1 hypothetical protein [Candidatus Neomarinimicrobiota bacterium]MBT7945833.1 hypothetical protein [Candidatus Neomarinimicrobiota bacterium]